MQDRTLAPVVMFVYNRPDHTRRAWEALCRNAEFADTPVYIYADAAANEDAVRGVRAVRQYLQGLQHADLHLILREENYGIERNEVNGITTVIRAHGKAVIVEDDIEAGPYFLRYMNLALDRYANEQQVYAITAYSIFSSEQAARLPEYGFLRAPVNWGWATWADRWSQNLDTIDDADVERLRKDARMQREFNNGEFSSDILLSQSKRGAYTWDTIWYWVIFKNRGLVLRTAYALCDNIGTDGSGVHFNDPRGKVVRRDTSHYPGDEMPSEITLTESYCKVFVRGNFLRTWRYQLGHNPLFNALGIWDNK